MSYETKAARIRALRRAIPAPGERVNVACAIDGRRGTYEGTVLRVLRSGRVLVAITRRGAPDLRVTTDRANVLRPDFHEDTWPADLDMHDELERLLALDDDTTHHNEGKIA